MLRKKETYTVVTPIPSFIPRQLALDLLHSHSEIITLNPLVLDHKAIPAPRNAAADEYYSTWYEITERIQYVPGMGKMGSGEIKFNGCFHDMPWGLQTHIYAPLSIDLQNKYRVGGNQPGLEPPEQRELGMEALNIPKDGLYLRQETEIKCNITMMSFVKSQLKAASKEMVGRIIKKAELLDAGVLQAMMTDGKLKTYNPLDRSNTFSHVPSSGAASPSLSHGMPYSPHTAYASPYSPQPHQQSFSQQQQQPPLPPKEPITAMELPGDSTYLHPTMVNQQPPQPQSPNPSNYSQRDSIASSDPRWSQMQQSFSGSDPHRSSVSSTTSSTPGYTRPGFAAELPSHDETSEEYRQQAMRR